MMAEVTYAHVRPDQHISYTEANESTQTLVSLVTRITRTRLSVASVEFVNDFNQLPTEQ